MKLSKTLEEPVPKSAPKEAYNPRLNYPPLPALKTLSELTLANPVILIDTREQEPLKFSRLTSEEGTLTTGDYSFHGGETLFSVERKSISDLVGCCMDANRERFERELLRLRGYRFRRLLVVGPRHEVEHHMYRSAITPNAVLGTVAAFEIRYDVPVVWSDGPTAAASLIEDWVWWYAREMVLSVNKLKRGCKYE